jgi:hypothetical protein
MFRFLLNDCILIITNSKEPSSWEADIFSAIQEFPNILWAQNVYCHVPKSLPVIPIESQINLPIQPHSDSLRYISILFFLLRLFLSGFFPYTFLT